MDVDQTTSDGLLVRNLQALRAACAGAAEQVASLPDEKALALIPAEGGGFFARVKCEDGAEVLLASGRDPVAEAGRWCDHLNVDDDKQAVAVAGCGLGYHVAELLRRRPGMTVVVLEPSAAVVQAALRCHDFVAELLGRRLVFVIGEARTDLFSPLQPHNAELMLGVQLAQHPASGRAWPDACLRLHSAFTDYLHFVRSSLATALEISTVSMENLLANIGVYLDWPGVDDLKDCCKGRPGVCVAAGPSLRKNVHLLERIKGKAPIFAVQTVLKTLLSMGVEPDFVTALDFSERSRSFYEGVGRRRNVTLVVDPKVHPVAPRTFEGPKRMFANDALRSLLAEMDDGREGLTAGSTVAHLNFYLARYMGCDPIVLVGQDLGFGDNIYYAPGNPIHDRWSPELNRFCTLEMKEWQRIANMRPNVRKVPGQSGAGIFTDAQMFTYLQQFERDIAATEAKVVNATEGGAQIAGAENLLLTEVIERFVEGLAELRLPEAKERRDGAKRKAAAECLRKRLDELKQMDEICRNVLVPLKKMRGTIHNAKEFNRLHAQMDRWRVKIEYLQRIYSLVSDVAQVAELRRLQMDKAIDRRKMDEISERREQLTRDIQYVSLLKEGVAVMRKGISRALAGVEGKE